MLFFVVQEVDIIDIMETLIKQPVEVVVTEAVQVPLATTLMIFHLVTEMVWATGALNSVTVPAETEILATETKRRIITIHRLIIHIHSTTLLKTLYPPDLHEL